jgi:hypothetical protein
MHELSPAAALRTSPNGRLITLTEGADLLQGYFTDNGFNNIASEWWHFTDRAGQNSADSVGILGEFMTGSEVHSTLPDGSRNDSFLWKLLIRVEGWDQQRTHKTYFVIKVS